LGKFIFLHQVMASLKKERERQGLTLADLSDRTGVDQAALSKLETGSHGNPTMETLYRIALARGKVIACNVQDARGETAIKRPATRAR
jgi:transcriptional regulator with XRE-family HTH domain